MKEKREEDENKDVETHKSSPSKLASEQTKQIMMSLFPRQSFVFLCRDFSCRDLLWCKRKKLRK